MSKQTRRQFIKTTGAASLALAGPSINVLGANEQIRVAVCGVHSQGWANTKAFHDIKGVKVVALCDPDSEVLSKRIQDFAKTFEGETVEGHRDYREVLDRDDIDAVGVATPNHWHCLIGIHACQAGKDAYVQKPLSHKIWEGRQLATAAHKYNRIVQTGTQNRSDIGLREFYPYLHSGQLGKVKMVRGLCYRNRKSIGKLDKPLVPPETVDYNLWLGPSQDVPIYRPRFHYDWHWDWNCGNGDIGNQGPHEMDLIRWVFKDDSVPTRVMSFGGRFGWNDAGTTPNMQFAIFEYHGVPVYFEVRDLWVKPDLNTSPNYMGARVAIVVTCENGYFIGGRGGGWVYDNDGKRVKQFKGDGGKGHFENFIRAVRTRKESDLHAPCENGHLSACLSHMANASYRTGADMSPDELRERMSGDKEAMDAIERYSAQLAEWHVDYKKTPWTVGVSLGFDPEKERFTGEKSLARKANKLLRGPYRKEFMFPEKV
ncbi:MAG: Gfo/Idh/MocA family oxidoreductase [Candidatus Hydrogenedentes bacterium]|nr:Gfo/Idh/MocA family oxidoreductase [Candidatus Hydrogenedentota bacterium]